MVQNVKNNPLDRQYLKHVPWKKILLEGIKEYLENGQLSKCESTIIVSYAYEYVWHKVLILEQPFEIAVIFLIHQFRCKFLCANIYLGKIL